MAEQFRGSVDPEDLRAVDDATPLSRPVVLAPQRRHRWLTIPSGWMLVVCLFLPSLKLCENSEPIAMVMIPFCWPQYVVGGLIALTARARLDAVRLEGRALFLLIRLTAIGWGGYALYAIAEGYVELESVLGLAAAVFMLAITWRPPTELSVAAISVLCGIGALAFTLVIALEPLAVFGAYVGVGSAGGVTLGSIVWTLEVLWARRRGTC